MFGSRKPKSSDLYAAYQAVFNDSPEAQMVLHDLMRVGNVLRSSYIQGERSHDTAFNEGQRNLVLRILAMKNVSPADIEKMAAEAQYYRLQDRE